MRGLPFFKAKNKPQFAGLNFSDVSSGGGGGGGSSGGDIATPIKTNYTYNNKDVYIMYGTDVATEDRSFKIVIPSGYSILTAITDRDRPTTAYHNNLTNWETDVNGDFIGHYTGVNPSSENPVTCRAFFILIKD